jgi:hypothetical protein
MNCRYCGTDLPDEALFCPECGRAVNVNVDVVPERMPVAASTGFSIADLAFSSPGAESDPSHEDERDLPDGSALDGHPGTARCPQCGEPMADGDVFCGECGFVLRTVSPPSGAGLPDPESADLPTSIIILPDLITLSGSSEAEAVVQEAAADDSGGSDGTTELEPVAFGALDALGDAPQESGEVAPEAGAPDESVLDESVPDEVVPDEPSVDELVHETPAHAAAAAAAVLPIDPDLEFDEPLPFALPMATKAAPSPRSRPIPDPFPWGTDRPLREDIEATRIIADTASGVRYVLQFSTGESVTVLGSGLVGRNPSMQPGEYVDQLVPIFDAGKSVSKTHLEYGQEGGRFWISDRYSTNGSTIRQPDTEPRRADPGRRYFIARGTRVDLGEQFFVVS